MKSTTTTGLKTLTFTSYVLIPFSHTQNSLHISHHRFVASNTPTILIPSLPFPSRRTRRHSIILSSSPSPSSSSSSTSSSSISSLQSILSTLSSHVIRPGTDVHKSLESQIGSIEKQGGFSLNTTSITRTLQNSSWHLIATDARAVIKNAGGITGFPGTTCTRIDVDLRRDGQARTVESISLFFGLWKTRNQLFGKWTLDKQTGILRVTYAQLNLLGLWSLRADSQAVLRTTYCSQDLRIGRTSNSNPEFYVFVRNVLEEDEEDQ